MCNDEDSREWVNLAILIAVIHCIIGNMIGISISNLDYVPLWIIFFPYSYIAGLSEFAGWGMFSIIFEIGSLFLTTAFFYPIGMMLERRK